MLVKEYGVQGHNILLPQRPTRCLHSHVRASFHLTTSSDREILQEKASHRRYYVPILYKSSVMICFSLAFTSLTCLGNDHLGMHVVPNRVCFRRLLCSGVRRVRTKSFSNMETVLEAGRVSWVRCKFIMW